jgi:hypothetical protein
MGQNGQVQGFLAVACGFGVVEDSGMVVLVSKVHAVFGFFGFSPDPVFVSVY